jgi:zinc transporter, ZIP family
LSIFNTRILEYSVCESKFTNVELLLITLKEHHFSFQMAISATALAFILVVAAGASTCIGAAAVYQPSFIHLASKTTLGASLGLSAGVMLYVSFVEIFRKSVVSFSNSGLSDSDSYLFATLCFFIGFVLMNLMNMLVHYLDPDEIGHDGMDFEILDNVAEEEMSAATTGAKAAEGIKLSTPEPLTEAGIELQNSRMDIASLPPQMRDVDIEENRSMLSTAESLHEKKKIIDEKLHRMGLVTALAIGIHNFPEGLATFVATLDNPTVGIALAIAIAIHNIPEGLCVSIPIYFASGDRHKAFMWGCLSGATEVIAAALGWIVLSHVVGDEVYAVLFGTVAGMMVNICVYQLMPTAHKYDPQDKYVSNAVLVGMAVMALSLVVFLY